MPIEVAEPAAKTPQPQWREASEYQPDVPHVPVISDSVRRIVTNNASWGVPGKVAGLLDKDAGGGTQRTFDEAVMGIAEATRGEKNTKWLQLALWDKAQSTGDLDMVSKLRQVGILSTALGENQLADGTRYDPTKPSKSFGKDLDLGGGAAGFFRQAMGSLSSAEEYVQGHLGQTVNGKTLTKTDATQLTASREALAARLEKIYGDHQIIGKDGAFARFREFLDTDYESAVKFMLNLKMKADRQSGDPAFQGKLYRDAALCCLAATDMKMDKGDGLDAKLAFGTAVRMLESAKKLDPNHAQGDIASLEMIVSQLRQRGLK